MNHYYRKKVQRKILTSYFITNSKCVSMGKVSATCQKTWLHWKTLSSKIQILFYKTPILRKFWKKINKVNATDETLSIKSSKYLFAISQKELENKKNYAKIFYKNQIYPGCADQLWIRDYMLISPEKKAVSAMNSGNFSHSGAPFLFLFQFLRSITRDAIARRFFRQYGAWKIDQPDNKPL